MIAEELFDLDKVIFDSTVKTKEEALKFIANFAEDVGVVKSSKAYFKGLKKREKEITTGFKDGIAIPHSKNKTVLKPSLLLVKFMNPIEWESMDDKPVHIAFALAIPEGDNQEHLKLLSTISRALIDNSFTDAILETTTENEIYEVVKGKLSDPE